MFFGPQTLLLCWNLWISSPNNVLKCTQKSMCHINYLLVFYHFPPRLGLPCMTADCWRRAHLLTDNPCLPAGSTFCCKPSSGFGDLCLWWDPTCCSVSLPRDHTHCVILSQTFTPDSWAMQRTQKSCQLIWLQLPEKLLPDFARMRNLPDSELLDERRGQHHPWQRTAGPCSGTTRVHLEIGKRCKTPGQPRSSNGQSGLSELKWLLLLQPFR